MLDDINLSQPEVAVADVDSAATATAVKPAPQSGYSRNSDGLAGRAHGSAPANWILFLQVPMDSWTLVAQTPTGTYACSVDVLDASSRLPLPRDLVKAMRNEIGKIHRNPLSTHHSKRDPDLVRLTLAFHAVVREQIRIPLNRLNVVVEPRRYE